MCDVDDYDSYQLNNAIIASRNYNSGASVPAFEPPPPYSERAGALERVVEGHVPSTVQQEQRLDQSFETSEFLNQSHSSNLSLPLDLHERIAALEMILQSERASVRAAGVSERAATAVRVVPHRLDIPPSVQLPPVQPLSPLPPCPPLVPRSFSQDSCHVDLPPISVQRSFSLSQHHHIQRRYRRKSKNRRRSQTGSQSIRSDSDRQITIRRSTGESMDRREEEEREERVEEAEREERVEDCEREATPEEGEMEETIEEQEREGTTEEGEREETVEEQEREEENIKDRDDDQVDNVTESDEGSDTIEQSTNNQNENEGGKDNESSEEDEEETKRAENSEEHIRNFSSYQFELHRQSGSLNCIVKKERENECKSDSYCVIRTADTV